MRLTAAHVLVAVAALVTGLVVYLAFFAGAGPSDQAAPVDVSDPASAPVIQLDAEEVRLGTVSNREPTVHQVTVRNAGKMPLEIRDVRTSCACTQGKMRGGDPAVIPPGGSDVLEITFYPKRVYGFHSHKVLTLFSNDPARPSLELHVLADVDPEFEVVPDEVDFGTVTKGVEATRTIRFRPLRVPVSHVTGLSTAQPGRDAEGVDPSLRKSWLRVEQVEVPASGWRNPDFPEVDIRVTLDPAAPPGELRQSFYISVDTPRFPFLMVPVRALVEAPYTIEGAISQGQVFIRQGEPSPVVRFRAASGALRPVSVAADPPDLVDVTVETPDDATVEVRLAARGGLPPGKHSTNLKVSLRNDAGVVFEEQCFAHVYVAGGGN
ncbi:MAG TPA: DUF1573 domain-containing protein [Candidatus Hydrogenedentes bacterium]|nr:DUF1573 domain-containing protein [Candidatus Hydrogenedentota bacterium]